MKKIDRKASKEIREVLSKYKHLLPKYISTNKFVTQLNAVAGHMNVTLGSFCLLDPTGASGLVNFSLATMSYTVARYREKNYQEECKMNEAGQYITGREDIVHCLLAIENEMQDHANALGVTLHESHGCIGDSEIAIIQNMHQLYRDAQKLMPYVDVQSDEGTKLLFEINCDDILSSVKKQPYTPIYHQEFLHLFNIEAEKKRKEMRKNLEHTQETEEKRTKQTFQKFRR